MAAIWQKAGDGIEVAHSTKCPRHPRGAHLDPGKRTTKRGSCACPKGPSWRGVVWDPVTGNVKRGPATKNEAEARRWTPEHDPKEQQSRAFGDVLLEWWELYQAGTVPKRRGHGPPKASTITGYRGIIFGAPMDEKGQRRRTSQERRGETLLEAWGDRPGDDITPVEWQRWFLDLAKAGLSRSRLTETRAIVRSVYAYATLSTIGIWKCPDPTADVFLPAQGTKRKWRVALMPEAHKLLAALPLDDRVPHALAMGVGLRRSEIGRLEWPEVNLDAREIHVRESKSDAGTNRRAPMLPFAVEVLREEWARQGRPTHGPVVRRSLIAGKFAEACDKAWKQAGLTRLTLQEGRRTYASTLMAAGYVYREIMAFMGHSDMAATERYLDELPQPGDLSRADRLAAYEQAWRDRELADAA